MVQSMKAMFIPLVEFGNQRGVHPRIPNARRNLDHIGDRLAEPVRVAVEAHAVHHRRRWRCAPEALLRVVHAPDALVLARFHASSSTSACARANAARSDARKSPSRMRTIAIK